MLFLELTIATFTDGGWFGPNGGQPRFRKCPRCGRASPGTDHSGETRCWALDDGSPRLRFWYFIDVPDADEGGQLRFLTPEGVEIASREAIFKGPSAGWQEFSIAIPVAGRDQPIIIEFRFLTDEDDEVASERVIDDFVIRD